MLDSKKAYQYLVDNTWKSSDSGKTLDVYSPHDNKVVGKVQAISKEEINKAFTSSELAFQIWKNTSLFERAELLNKVADKIEERAEEISEKLEREIGKSKDSAKREVARSVDYIRFVVDAARNMTGEIFHGDAFAGFPKGKKTAFLERVPLGVVLAISPYNYPINLALTKIAPALVAGNTVVFKPATQGALASLHMVNCFVDVGFPKGVLNAITLSSSANGDYLVKKPEINLLAFTGSSKTGLEIAKQTEGKIPLLMELGGKDSTIVLDDADLDLAAEQITKGGLSFCGQRCTAVKRVFVDKKVMNELGKKITEFAKKEELDPLINEKQRDYVLELIDDAKKNGAKIVTGGTHKGNRIDATVLMNVPEKARIFSEEQFGPVIPLSSMTSLEDSINWINKSPYALQSSIYTQDIDKAFEIAGKLDTGSVQINGKSDRGPDNFPFIGIRESGIGPAQGTKETIRAMTREKIVVLNRKITNNQ